MWQLIGLLSFRAFYSAPLGFEVHENTSIPARVWTKWTRVGRARANVDMVECFEYNMRMKSSYTEAPRLCHVMKLPSMTAQYREWRCTCSVWHSQRRILNSQREVEEINLAITTAQTCLYSQQHAESTARREQYAHRSRWACRCQCSVPRWPPVLLWRGYVTRTWHLFLCQAGIKVINALFDWSWNVVLKHERTGVETHSVKCTCQHGLWLRLR